MHLDGSFADGGLRALLESVMLSGNSAVVRLQSAERTAWAGFASGELVRLAVSDDSLSRDGILRRAGLDPCDRSEEAGTLVQEAALEAVLELVRWESGEFRLDPFSGPAEAWDAPEGLTLDPPLTGFTLSLAALEPAGSHRHRVVLVVEEPEAEEQTLLEPDGERALPPAGSGPVLTGTVEAEGLLDLLETVMGSGTSGLLQIRCGSRGARLGLAAGELTCVAPANLGEVGAGPAAVEVIRELVGPGVFAFEPFADPSCAADEQAAALSPPLRWRDLGDIMAGGSEAPGTSGPGTAAPQEPSPADSTGRARSEGLPVRPCAVIVADPNPDVLRLVKQALRRPWLHVHAFQLPEDALHRLQQYLVRGCHPLLIMGTARDAHATARRRAAWRRLIDRIYVMSSQVRMVLLTDGQASDPRVERTLPRPVRHASGRIPREVEERLRRELEEVAAVDGKPPLSPGLPARA
jgi:hypothetical protein